MLVRLVPYSKLYHQMKDQMMDDVQEVRDGNRRLVFHGKLLSSSSSKTHRSKGRWIEFELYSTDNGGYVLSRVGQTRFVHSVDCAISARNGLDRMSLDEVGSLRGLYQCPECSIDVRNDSEFCPEVPRFWAMKLFAPEDVIDSLHKRDSNGNLYLTNVARDLLEGAAELDNEIAGVYYNDEI